MARTTPVPVHVLTGFLGSGKTSLLNRLVRSNAMKDAAVIINEFGEVGLDHHLVESSDDTVIELSNGCLCCTVRGQLVETLESVAQGNPSRIVIETTGLADPVPVLQAIMGTPALAGVIKFCGLLTVFDVLHGESNLSNHREAQVQVTLADRIILSKLDMLKAEERETKRQATITMLASLNPAATVLSRDEALKDMDSLLQTVAVPASGKTADLQQDQGHHHHHGHHHDAHAINRHSDSIVAATLRHDKPIDAGTMQMFLDLLLSAHGDHVLRLKGLANISGDERPTLIQAVHRTLSPPEKLDCWPTQSRDTELVVFLQDMEPLFVEKLFNGFMGIPAVDTPDRQTFETNPLGIPGIGRFRP